MSALAAIMNFFERVWTGLCRPLIAILNVIFRPAPADGHISPWRIGVWVAFNCALLFMALNAGALHIRPLMIGAFLLLHVLIILGSLRVMSEEKSVLEGTLAANALTFSVTDAVNNLPLLAISVVFYVLGLPALIDQIESANLAQILSQKPVMSNRYVTYLTCVLNEVPLFGPIIYAAASLTGVSKNINADIVYAGLTGNAMRLFVVATVGTIVVRAIVLRLQQATHKAAIARSLESGDSHVDRIRGRLARISPDLRARLERTIDTHVDDVVRHRVKDALARLAAVGHSASAKLLPPR